MMSSASSTLAVAVLLLTTSALAQEQPQAQQLVQEPQKPASIVAAAASIAAAVATPIPHVSQCNLCTTCHVRDTPPSDAATLRSLLAARDLDFPSPDITSVRRAFYQALRHKKALLQGSEPQLLTQDMVHAATKDAIPKAHLPNCTECYGCNTQLTHMHAETTFFNITYVNEKGASSSWLFRATTPHVPGGQAVVKVYCVPIPKHPGGKIPVCSTTNVLRTMLLHRALAVLADECGFTDIIPMTWVAKVDAVIPEEGFHIGWHGLWMEMVKGVSLESLLHRGIPARLAPEKVLDLMHNRLNKTQVTLAALFDLLTSQCDRHAQNIFIGEDGHLHLIDNEVCLQSAWTSCAVDSVLLPTTQKQEIARLSNQYILKYVTESEAPKGEADPQLLLDYRCYLPEGVEEMGTNYPQPVAQCLRKIAGMTQAEVEEHYGLPPLPAKNLQTRAADMVNKGFEWTVKYGEPRNPPPKRYLVQPKCCRIKWEQGRYRCDHAYNPSYELPLGDPITGRAWTKPRRDTGVFEGGTRY